MKNIQEVLNAIQSCNENIKQELSYIAKEKFRLEEFLEEIEEHAILIRRYTRLVLNGIDKINK